MKNSTIKLLSIALLLITIIAFNSCRGDDDEISPSVEIPIAPGAKGPIKGFYLLNEANMGSNKSSIDYFDSESGSYFRNIYPTINPSVVHELGDVGNDIQVYGNKLYAVVNCSHYVEVMDLNTAAHHSSVTVTNCRYITFDKAYAYVSSYNGPVQIDPKAPMGSVVKIDTTNMSIVGTCMVGYQPEEMVVKGNKLYVANSGGYRAPNYDNTVSVINLDTFEEMYKITVGVNLHRLELDDYGNLYVSSRGDYKTISSKTFIIDTKTDKVTDVLHLLPNSNMTLVDDSLYVYSTEWNHVTEKNTVSYAIVDTRTKKIVTRNFITDGTDKFIKVPYGIAVHPETREIFVTDGKDYVSPGTLYCFTPEGKRKWQVQTGDIPAHIVFTRKRLENIDLLSNKQK